MQRIRAAIGTVLAMLSMAAQALVPTTADVEPNNTIATATALRFNAGRAIAAGSITPGDQDYWRIDNIPANGKIWAYVDTGGLQNPGATTRVVLIEIFAPDGTLLEIDDNDGTGNGLDGTVESASAGIIAGRMVPAGGTAYVRVRATGNQVVIDPYRLYVVVTRSNLPGNESEPNDTAANADALLPAGGIVGLSHGALASAADVDIYAVHAVAGDILFLSVDGDPTRIVAGKDLVLTLYGTDGTSQLLECNSALGAGLVTNPPAEGCGWRATTSGVHYLKVSLNAGAALGSGTYQVLVANMTRSALDAIAEAEPNDTPASATPLPLNRGRGMGIGALSAGDADYWRIEVTTANPTLWVYVDTGGVQGTGATSRDSIVTIYGPDGITVFGFDNDNGTGNGLDSTVESTASSATGISLVNSGTYYVKVSGPAGAIVNPYRLFVAVAGSDENGGQETEPNGTIVTANPISTFTQPITYRLGSIGAAGDKDYYSVHANAGDVVLMVAQSDVANSGTGTDIVVELWSPDGLQLLLSCDSSATGSLADFAAEGCAYQIGVRGTYFVAVRHFNAAAASGQYALMVANMTAYFAPAIAAVTETEPNSTIQSATPLPLNGGRGIGRGEVAAPDVDFWRIDAVPANSKLWAYVDTGGTQAQGGTSRDSVLTVFGGNGVLIETDADDGTGNGLDGTSESQVASVIAGRNLTAGGTYFLRVGGATAGTVIAPYTLYVVVTPASFEPAVETEPNATSAQANTMMPPGVPVGVRSGTISQANDVDLYKFDVAAGDVVVMAADADPVRDATGINLEVAFLGTDGATALLSCNSSGAGSLADPAGEGCAYRFTTAGTYFARVREANIAGSGNYTLMLANMMQTMTLDVDASAPDTTYEPRSDGLLVLRYLFSLTGNALTSGAVGATASRSSAAEIQQYLDVLRPSLDVDGNGAAEALADGLLIIRYLFGLRGDALINSAISPGATRTTAAAIEAYIAGLLAQ